VILSDRTIKEEVAAGRIIIEVSVDPSGNVLKTSSLTRDMSRELTKCIENKVHAWTFEGVPADKRTFQMVFKFRAKR